jgi:hypothetical protein
MSWRCVQRIFAMWTETRIRDRIPTTIGATVHRFTR